MARYTGPVCRLCRRFGEKLFLKGDRCLLAKCACERRMYPPGPRTTRRRKISDRGLQLREKQKARVLYGVLERQFRKHLEMAERMPGAVGENLLQILERRLDNVVYRMGLAESRPQARQLVLHGHFALNGKKAQVPSILVQAGDEVALWERSRGLDFFKGLAKELKGRAAPGWLSVDVEALKGKVLALPTKGDVDAKIHEQVIVEYYSR